MAAGPMHAYRRTDRQTDMTKVPGSLHHYAKAPKNNALYDDRPSIRLSVCTC